MRYFCWFCSKSVTSELSDDSVIRGLIVCPECIQAKRITFPEDESKKSTSIEDVMTKEDKKQIDESR